MIRFLVVLSAVTVLSANSCNGPAKDEVNSRVQAIGEDFIVGDHQCWYQRVDGMLCMFCVRYNGNGTYGGHTCDWSTWKNPFEPDQKKDCK